MGASRRLAALGGALACLAYGALAISSGLDRISLKQPELAPSVPAPFASQALRSAGAELIGRGQARLALAKGEAAVRDAPLDPGSTALLGIARFRSGDGPGAERAFRIAGQLGWREQFTQTYWMGRALEIGDWRVAAMRLDALLRQRPALLAERRLLDPVESSAAGRAALAERILAGPGWLRPYTAALTDVPRPVLLLRAEVLSEVAARKGLLGCEAVVPLVGQLLAERAEREAAALWHQHCPGSAATLIHDGNFAAARLNQDLGSLAWTFIGQSDTLTSLEPDPVGAGQLVTAKSSASRDRLFVRQLILAANGNYRLSWLAQNSDWTPSDRVLASLSCRADPTDWLPAQYDRAVKRWQAVVVIDRSCKAQWLAFGLAPRPGTTRFGDVTLEPLRQRTEGGSPR